MENVTKQTATEELLKSFGAPLCHYAKPRDVVSLRRLERERSDGETKLVDVLVIHGGRGGCDGSVFAYDRHEHEVRTGDFNEHDAEDGGNLGAVEIEALRDEQEGTILILPAA